MARTLGRSGEWFSGAASRRGPRQRRYSATASVKKQDSPQRHKVYKDSGENRGSLAGHGLHFSASSCSSWLCGDFFCLMATRTCPSGGARSRRSRPGVASLAVLRLPRPTRARTRPRISADPRLSWRLGGPPLWTRREFQNAIAPPDLPRPERAAVTRGNVWITSARLGTVTMQEQTA
jgi:hypothetical protein